MYKVKLEWVITLCGICVMLDIAKMKDILDRPFQPKIAFLIPHR